jgi:short-subunit dehydrogenase
MKNTVLILGATSSIARATAEALAAKGYPLFLAGRDQNELERLTLHFKIKYHVDVHHSFFDAEDVKHHASFIHQVVQKVGTLEGLVIAFGESGEHQRAIYDFAEVEKILNRNFVGACAVLTYAANYFEQEKKGFIIGISSVAADLSHKNNYVYGAAKAGLATFLQGLRNRLHPFNIHVLTVKPYLVDTASTFGFSSFFRPLSPQYVGSSIVKSLEKSKQEVYIPKFWKPIMCAIGFLPNKILKRIKF